MHRLYLHIGLMKSGTTYLQQVWRANAEALAAQGIWTPAARGEPDTMLAVWDLAGRRPRGADDASISGRWHELVDAVAAHELCHLRVFGHGERFWALLATRVPDHAAWRRWLRAHAPELHAALA